MVPRQVIPAQDSSLYSSPAGILIVDDEPSVLVFLERGLRLNGFTIWPAKTGKEAVEIYRNHRESIAAVLMDVRMPDLDGPATLAALRSIDPEVRCCFMSGGIGRYTQEDLLACGAVHVLGKPFALAEVVRVLQQMVSEYQARVA
jgi:CheY-like chemotaxis protein